MLQVLSKFVFFYSHFQKLGALLSVRQILQKTLLTLPFYIIMKIPLYFTGFQIKLAV